MVSYVEGQYLQTSTLCPPESCCLVDSQGKCSDSDSVLFSVTGSTWHLFNLHNKLCWSHSVKRSSAEPDLNLMWVFLFYILHVNLLLFSET